MATNKNNREPVKFASEMRPYRRQKSVSMWLSSKTRPYRRPKERLNMAFVKGASLQASKERLNVILDWGLSARPVLVESEFVA